MKHALPALLLAASLCVTGAAAAAERIAQFSGDRSTQTREFEIEGPWLIDWRVNSDFPNSMGLAVTLLNASGAYEGQVVKTKAPGNGVRLVEQSGRYSFKVDATVANWTIKVDQLTREEAELYTPKSGAPE